MDLGKRKRSEMWIMGWKKPTCHAKENINCSMLISVSRCQWYRELTLVTTTVTYICRCMQNPLLLPSFWLVSSIFHSHFDQVNRSGFANKHYKPTTAFPFKQFVFFEKEVVSTLCFLVMTLTSTLTLLLWSIRSQTKANSKNLHQSFSLIMPRHCRVLSTFPRDYTYLSWLLPRNICTQSLFPLSFLGNPANIGEVINQTIRKGYWSWIKPCLIVDRSP